MRHQGSEVIATRGLRKTYRIKLSRPGRPAGPRTLPAPGHHERAVVSDLSLSVRQVGLDREAAPYSGTGD